MPKAQTDHDLRSNRLLGALEAASRKRLGPHLEPVVFKLGDMVCDAGGLLKRAYFPQGSVLSLLTVLENGAAIETANIGREGAFGLFAACIAGSPLIDASCSSRATRSDVPLNGCNMNSGTASMCAICS
jgi:hypothetical protein